MDQVFERQNQPLDVIRHTIMTTLPASLEKFFVFCPRLGPREETEHEKVLFYYPADASNNQQQSDIGITEAFVNFAK